MNNRPDGPTQPAIIASFDQNSIFPGNRSQILLDHCRFYGRRSVNRAAVREQRIGVSPDARHDLPRTGTLQRTIIYCQIL